jgi:hypothetical protein
MTNKPGMFFVFNTKSRLDPVPDLSAMNRGRRGPLLFTACGFLKGK